MAPEQPISELSDEQTNEVEFESNKYQAEVQLLKNTATYVHAGVAVDYGGFWESMHPLSSQLHSRKRQLNYWKLGLQDVAFDEWLSENHLHTHDPVLSVKSFHRFEYGEL